MRKKSFIMMQRRSNLITAQHSFKNAKNSETEDISSDELFPVIMFRKFIIYAEYSDNSIS